MEKVWGLNDSYVWEECPLCGYDTNTGEPRAQHDDRRTAARDTPTTDFGLKVDPSLEHDPVWKDLKGNRAAEWDRKPMGTFRLADVTCVEPMLSSKPINKVVSGEEPFREGYPVWVARWPDGRTVVIDGHHRVAMYAALGRTSFEARVWDLNEGNMSTFSSVSPHFIGRTEAVSPHFIGRTAMEDMSGPSEMGGPSDQTTPAPDIDTTPGDGSGQMSGPYEGGNPYTGSLVRGLVRKMAFVPPSRSGPQPTWLTDYLRDLIEGDGGYSFSNVLRVPKGGYMVSIYPEHERVVPFGKLDHAAIEQYINDKAGPLGERDNYLGAWLDGGLVYLDVSRHCRSLDEAMALARQYRQLAIFDLNTFEEVRVEEPAAVTAAGATPPANPYAPGHANPYAAPFVDPKRHLSPDDPAHGGDDGADDDAEALSQSEQGFPGASASLGAIAGRIRAENPGVSLTEAIGMAREVKAMQATAHRTAAATVDFKISPGVASELDYFEGNRVEAQDDRGLDIHGDVTRLKSYTRISVPVDKLFGFYKAVENAADILADQAWGDISRSGLSRGMDGFKRKVFDALQQHRTGSRRMAAQAAITVSGVDRDRIDKIVRRYGPKGEVRVSAAGDGFRVAFADEFEAADFDQYVRSMGVRTEYHGQPHTPVTGSAGSDLTTSRRGVPVPGDMLEAIR